MHWVYLSPHLDDAALSCGGIIWEQVQAGAVVEIWSICAGLPAPGRLTPYAELLHTRWQTGPEAVLERRQEDLLSCAALSARARHFDVPDCIYRTLPGGEPVVLSDAELFQPLKAGEAELVASLAGQIGGLLSAGTQVAAPLTLGGHMDHRLVRAAAEALGCPLWYYADYPYVLSLQNRLDEWIQPGWRAEQTLVSAGGLAAWQDSIAAHRSQISTFWGSEADMRAQIERYLREFPCASRLWATAVD